MQNTLHIIIMNIVVLSGGCSTEREVSLVSGQQVYDALKKKNKNVILLDVCGNYKNELLKIQDLQDDKIKQIFSSNIDWLSLIQEISVNDSTSKCYFGENVINICQMADIVFLALHGENGENGKLQAAFDLLGITYTGTDYISSALSMNKSLSKKLFLYHKIPTPESFTLRKENSDIGIIDFPKVIKVVNGGSSIGVYIVKNETEYKKALQEAFKLESEILIEDYIEGREFSVGIIDGKALPIIEIVPKEGFYDYKTKYTKGAAKDICPAEISTDKELEMKSLAEKVFQILNLKCYARIDFLMGTDENLYCLEANTLPGMTPTSLLPQEAAQVGISFDDLCMSLINLSLK